MRSSLDSVQVKALFTSCPGQYDVLIGLYKLTLKDWDEIEYILDGRPHIGQKGWRTIYDLFLEFDEKHHASEDIFPGGMWLGQGFKEDESLGDWEVDTSEMKIVLRSA
ncbi:MAG: hypothetical protein ACE14P_04240 [Methanotrichaceae archaeon]